MSTNPIEQNWKQVEAETPFCCDAHRDAFRAMYFSGAMAAMNAVTGWDPEVPGLLCISIPGMAQVAKELTAAYHAAQADAEVAQAGSVRH